MKTLSLHFYLLNEHFSPEYAEANHGGKETENNIKYEWEDELAINDVVRYQILRNEQIPIEGYLPDESHFSSVFKEMFVIEIETKEGTARLGVSESILDSFEEKEDRIAIFIKDYEPHGNPVPGIYVASKEFPKELVF